MTPTQIESLDWKKSGGLIPAVVQDAETLQVLMLGYMNEEALVATLETRKATFFSRSKERLWVKGETSGNFLELVKIDLDCDADSLLVSVVPRGPACHRNTTSCFTTESAPGLGFLSRLSRVIEDRFKSRPKGSYTTQLFEGGVDRMAQKVGEEGVEVVIAAKNEDPEPLRGEAADLLFHLMVLLRARSVPFQDVVDKLRERHPLPLPIP